MQIETGILLKSVPSSEKDYFDDTIVLIVEYNGQGAIGVILNKIYSRRLTDLQEFSSAPKLSLFEGGPMQQDHLYFIHNRKEVGGEKINDALFFGGDLKRSLSLMEEGNVNSIKIKVFVGYCGWDAGQLELEMAEGAWEPLRLENEIHFSDMCFG